MFKDISKFFSFIHAVFAVKLIRLSYFRIPKITLRTFVNMANISYYITDMALRKASYLTQMVLFLFRIRILLKKMNNAMKKSLEWRWNV